MPSVGIVDIAGIGNGQEGRVRVDGRVVGNHEVVGVGDFDNAALDGVARCSEPGRNLRACVEADDELPVTVVEHRSAWLIAEGRRDDARARGRIEGVVPTVERGSRVAHDKGVRSGGASNGRGGDE